MSHPSVQLRRPASAKINAQPAARMQGRPPANLLRKRALAAVAPDGLKPDMLGTGAILAFIIAGTTIIAYLAAFR